MCYTMPQDPGDILKKFQRSVWFAERRVKKLENFMEKVALNKVWKLDRI